MRRWRSWACPAMFVSLALLTAGCGLAIQSAAVPASTGLARAEAPQPQGLVALPTANPAGVPAGYAAVAATQEIELFLDPANGQIAVVQRATGTVWDSLPAGFSTQSGWTQALSSAFKLELVNGGLTQIRPVYGAGSGRKVAVRAIPGGDQVQYGMGSYGLTITIDYVLRGGTLVWTLPAGGIVRAAGGARVAHVLPLPYFGSFPTGTGDLVIPDGAGALVSGADLFGSFPQGFDGRVWGSGLPPWTPAEPWTPHVDEPLYGIVHNGSAVAVTATVGSARATVQALPAGVDVALNRIRFDFRLRRRYVTYVNQFTSTQAYTATASQRGLQVDYTFLSGAQASTAGIASAYRQQLQSSGGLPQAPRSAGAALHVSIIMAVHRPGASGTAAVALTTFAEAEQLLQAVQEQGAHRIDATLIGWSAGGVGGGAPHVWPPAGELGGTSGLTALLRWAGAHNVQIHLGVSARDAYGNSGGFSPSSQTLVTPVNLPVWDPTTSEYLLNGPATLGLVDASLARLRTLFGQPGMDLIGLGRDVPAQTATGAAGIVAAWRAAAAAAARSGGLQVQGGNSYLWPYAHLISDAPIVDGGALFEQQMVPLWEMVVHGVVPYSAGPVNFAANPRKATMQAAALGAFPALELSWRSGEAVGLSANDPYWAASYRNWLSLVPQVWAASVDVSAVSGLPMTAYSTTATGVIVASFGGSGATAQTLVVNPQATAASWQGQSIPADSLRLVGGGAG